VASQPISQCAYCTLAFVPSIRSERKKRGFHMRILGLDVGVASIGWAVLEFSNGIWSIVAQGVRTFNAPTVGGKGEDKFMSLAASKRRFLGEMRQHRRKASKMNEVRRILFDAGLLSDLGKDALALAQLEISPKGKPQVTPYALRAKGLSERLGKTEFAVVLGSLVARSGFKPSGRPKGKNESDERNKILASSVELRAYAQKGYRTIGEMIARDESFRTRTRNKPGNYAHTPLRSELLDEIRILFEKQKKLENDFATDSLRDKITKLMDRTADPKFDYYPVGTCRFEFAEKRAARRSPSFEFFRLLTRLVNLRVLDDGKGIPPTREQIDAALKEARERGTITFTDLRRLWMLGDDKTFKGLRNDREREAQDIAERNGAAMAGTKTLLEVLPEFAGAPDLAQLDKIAWILSFAVSEKIVERDLGALGLPPAAVVRVVKAYGAGRFNEFTRSGHISAKACARLSALLPDVMDLKKCESIAYGEPKARPREPIRNPVTRRVVRETCQQVEAIIRENGTQAPIDRIHVEFARDVALSEKGRQDLEDEHNKLNAKRKKLLKEFADAFPAGPEPAGNQLLMFELAKEQLYRCLYSGKRIDLNWIKSKDNMIQIDHILPRSRSGMMQDRNNLVLCLTGANQNKRDCTPYEWFHGANRPNDWSWDEFQALVKVTKALPRKKQRFLLLEDASFLKKGFRKRSLVDTQYAARLIPDELRRHLSMAFGESTHMPRIVARPAKLVSWMRHSWGVQDLKYVNRERTKDDRHHAVDAIVIAAITDRMLVRAIDAAKRNERSGRPLFSLPFGPPWPTFEGDVRAKREVINVSRAVNTDFPGRIHKDTTYALTTVPGLVPKSGGRQQSVNAEAPDSPLKVIVRKATNDLELKDLARLRDRERNHRLVSLLEDWISKGKLDNEFPKWKYRDSDGTIRMEKIRSVTLISNDDPAFTPKRLIRKDSKQPLASLNRGEIFRVDVFENTNSLGKSKYLYVPMYYFDTIDESPPDKAFVLRKPYRLWPIVDPNSFLFSLAKFDYIKIRTIDDSVEGYFRGLDTNDGRVKVTPHFTRDESEAKRFSPTKIRCLSKCSVDRLGRISEVLREPRTWRGKACT
jgi:CRISPR-associated endonuclease Csn1